MAARLIRVAQTQADEPALQHEVGHAECKLSGGDKMRANPSTTVPKHRVRVGQAAPGLRARLAVGDWASGSPSALPRVRKMMRSPGSVSVGPVWRVTSASGLPGRLAAAHVVGGVKGGAGAVERAGHEVTVDLVGDLDFGCTWRIPALYLRASVGASTRPRPHGRCRDGAQGSARIQHGVGNRREQPVSTGQSGHENGPPDSMV